MKRRIAAAAVGAAALTGTMLAAPAYAAECAEDVACPTTVTFDVTEGALTITVPDTADLTTDGAPGGYAYGLLGAITVSDLRASLTPTWTATVTSTSFETGLGGTGEVIPNTAVYYCSGDATATTGTGTFTPGQDSPCDTPPPVDGDPLNTAVTAFSHTGGTGNNTATWNPLLTISIPISAVSGQYTGTISHTVT